LGDDVVEIVLVGSSPQMFPKAVGPGFEARVPCTWGVFSSGSSGEGARQMSGVSEPEPPNVGANGLAARPIIRAVARCYHDCCVKPLHSEYV